MENTANQIKSKIKNSKRGKLFFPDDFAALGTPDAIRLALGKLHKSGLIMRVAHGIYYYPNLDKPEPKRFGKTSFLPNFINKTTSVARN
jgi:predicted transcriptional regulator of viral defense system